MSKPIPKTSPFFDFFNPLKQIKDKSFSLKTLLKTSVKTLVNERNLALENLVENNQEMGYLYPHFKSSRWQLTRAFLPFRSTGQRSHFWPLSPPVDRPVDRARSREQLLSGRSTARSTELKKESRLSARSTGGFSREQSYLEVDRPGRPASPAWLRAHSVHVGRPAARPTGSQPVQQIWVLKTWVFIIN